jgi:hypothetical protein
MMKISYKKGKGEQRPSNLKKRCISPQNSSLKGKNNTSFEAKKCSRRKIGERIWQTN